ncbi:MAG TPA: hypothetical protein VF654_07750, partial [Pyrinomonadaceae bacterium]
MNNRSFLLLSLTAVVFAPALGARAQTAAPPPVFTRPRVVSVAQQTPTATPAPTPQAPAARPAPYPTPAPQATPPQTTSTPTTVPQFTVPAVPLQPAHPPSLNKFRERAAEAQRMLKSRLTLTSMTPNT